MFNLFRKKQRKQQQKAKEPQGKPFDISDTKADLQAYYDLSVQRKAQDFIITTVATDSGDEISVAMDSLDGCDAKGLQNAYEANFVGQEIIFTHFAAKSFIGFNNCAILAQDWLINKALCLPCEDAIAINYDITLKNTDDTDKDIISEMKCLSEDKENIYDIKSVCECFATNKRKFGQALCFPLVDGADYSVPFNLDGIDRGTYRGMCVIEPYWVAPVLDMKSTTDPMSKRFYKPTWFRMPDGRLIHYTWFIFNTYTEVADILKPTYYFGGVPLTQMLYEQVYAAQKTANEAPMLAQSKRLNYMEGNLNAFLNDEERLNKEITLMTWLRNNFGWLFIKKDQRIGQLDTSLTDFDAVTMLGFQLVAAISGVQAARLLETSPKGWQSSGSLEDKNYSKLQQSIQRGDYVPILNMHYKLMAKSRHGLDRDYECVFDPIDTPTEKERAEIKEINSRTDMNYIQAGVISPDEARTGLREDINSGYNTLSEEIEGEGADPFGDLMGGGENSQDPFCKDTFNFDEWKENEHPRDKEGKFTTGSSQNSGIKSDIKTTKQSQPQTSKTIAGAKQGKPMSFKEANEGKVNPNYSKGGIFRRNCQSSVAVFEARLRGYDIETKDVNPETIRDLSFEPNLAYIDPQTGQNPQFIKSHARNSNDCKKWLDEQIKPGERYAFGYSPELSINDNGHIITVYKTNDGVLKFYDPQDGKNYDASFLDNIGYETPFGNIIICFSPMIFRIDDKELNYDILEKISQPSKKQDN